MPSSASFFRILTPPPRTSASLIALLEKRPLLFTHDGNAIHPIRKGGVEFSPFADNVVQITSSHRLAYSDPVQKQVRNFWRERKWDEARAFCENEIAKLDVGYARILLLTDLAQTYLILSNYSKAISCYQQCEDYLLSKPLPDYRDLAVAIAQFFLGEGNNAYQRINQNLALLRDYIAKNPALKASLRIGLILMLENLSTMASYLDHPELSQRSHEEAAVVVSSTPRLNHLQIFWQQKILGLRNELFLSKFN